MGAMGPGPRPQPTRAKSRLVCKRGACAVQSSPMVHAPRLPWPCVQLVPVGVEDSVFLVCTPVMLELKLRRVV
jgi:hypothetical protein